MTDFEPFARLLIEIVRVCDADTIGQLKRATEAEQQFESLAGRISQLEADLAEAKKRKRRK